MGQLQVDTDVHQIYVKARCFFKAFNNVKKVIKVYIRCVEKRVAHWQTVDE